MTDIQDEDLPLQERKDSAKPWVGSEVKEHTAIARHRNIDIPSKAEDKKLLCMAS